MKKIYFVTEGVTDQIILEGLIEHWLDGEDFLCNRIQPPSSDYAIHIASPLSQGWKGVVTWCESQADNIKFSREEVIKNADLVVIHIDADVGRDTGFSDPAHAADIPPASLLCKHVQNVLLSFFNEKLPENVIFCIPSLDLEAWLVAGLHPELADDNHPVNCFDRPARLLAGKNPHRLVRYKDGILRKQTNRYKMALPKFIHGWNDCVVRVPEAEEYRISLFAVLNLK